MNNDIFRPPPELTISQWADEFRYLSAEASPEPGKWLTSRAEYQRDMMDAIKLSERVVIMTAAQVGKSELLLNTLGYFIHYDPCPVLMLQPTIQMAEDFSKDRLAPMIRDTPVLAERVADPKSRTSGNTLLHKNFTGGHVTLVGTNSPASLASRPVRVLLCDEVDRYPHSAGEEGDPLTLAVKRTSNFWNRRIIQVSTPAMKETSRIEPAYSLSTQEEWCIPCPKCGHYQPYSWDNLLYKDRTEPVMRCVKCGQEFSESDWKAGIGRWIAGAESSTRGFHLNAFASPWVSWPEIVQAYDEAYAVGEEAIKGWINMFLGEAYENSEGVIELEDINSNGEDYPKLPDGTQAVPNDVLLLTCGVDVQDDRLELEVVGWGLGNQSWGIEYKILYGNPGSLDVWRDLDAYLAKEFRKITGEALVIACTCIDSGGHNTDSVYKFTKPRTRRRIFPIVGRGQWGMPSVRKPSRNNRYRVPLFTLGVSTIKGTLHTRLKAKKGEGGYCHFPKDKSTGYDEIYFSGLLSERMVIRRGRGRELVRWETRADHTRNEPLDCRVYAMGAFEILNPDLRRYAAGLGKKEYNTQYTETSAPQNTNTTISTRKSPPAPKRLVFRRGFAL
ncbi:MAG: phage terminase large subunit family protein [Synergistaceae bacterium]|nr:phage terminase large subunit family protein [Synergistaceae bacterium]